MDDEFELEMSPLCQKLTERGHSVQVEIYRGAGESGWLLEVVDEFGTSTIWDDRFATDAAALEEAKAAIREDGIESLIGVKGTQ